MPPRLPSLGGSPAKAIPLPQIQPASPRPNLHQQGSTSQICEINSGRPGIGSGSATAEVSLGPDQGNSGGSSSTDIRAGALPSEAPFPGDVYNGPIPLKIVALSEKGTIEQLVESLESLSRKNSPTSGSLLEIDATTHSSLEVGEDGSGSGRSGPSTALGDAAKNAVTVLKRLEKRRVNLGQTYMVTVKEAYECLKETEHILEEHHNQVGTQIFDQLKILTKALNADFKTLHHFFEKEKEEQEKQDNELRQKVDQASTSAVATEKAVIEADTKISGLLDNLKQTVEGLKISLDELGKQVKERKERQDNELFEKVDQVATSAVAAVIANSETRISELVGKVEAEIKTLDTVLDSRIEAASSSQNVVFERAAEAQTSVLKTALEGFQSILNGLSDNIQVLATQSSATAALLTLQNQLTESQKYQQTIEKKLTANWTEKLNTFQAQLKAQAERIVELEKPLGASTAIPELFPTFEMAAVEPSRHPALKFAVAGNWLLPHFHYHRHRVGIDWELSGGFHQGPNSLQNLLQNRWFVGIKVEPFMNLALQTLSSRCGVPDGKGTHTIRKLQIYNFHYIREIGETENHNYSRVEVGWDFGPVLKNGSLTIPVNLGGYWLEESMPSQKYFGNFGVTSIVENVTGLVPGLASDFKTAVKLAPTFWRFFSKTDWYFSSGAAFDTKYWSNSVHFPISAKMNGTLQFKAPGNKDITGETFSENSPQGESYALKENSKDDLITTLNDHIMRVETKIDDTTKKVTFFEPKLASLTEKIDLIRANVNHQTGLQAKLETRLQNQETLVADYERRLVFQKDEQEKCCHQIFKKIENLEKSPAGENDSYDTQPTENLLESVSTALIWAAIFEGGFGFAQGFGFGLLYLFLLRQQLRATNLFEKNIYRTGRFLIPGGFLAGLFVSLAMITINFLGGLPLDTKWPIIEKVAEVSESLVKKIPGQDNKLVQKLNKMVSYGFSFGFPFVSVAKVFYSYQTQYNTVLICIRLTVSFVVFSKITCWWTTWLLSDSELALKNQQQNLNLLPKNVEASFGTRIGGEILEQPQFSELPNLQTFWNQLCFSLEIFALDPMELPGEF